MAANIRFWQMDEFIAHSANVNCLALGHKSGRVLVTGGDDKKVNLWAIGKENCIMSLSGHSTPVECVKFSHTEDMVCAGSQAGSLKEWDLEAAKLFRTLIGHRDGIKCIDFHPYGDLLASGSLDTTIKLWDSRKKSSIFTYKGHEETVNSLKFSPDGQWIASGGEEGSVKLWDLRAGRVLQELNKHSGAITDVEFHPQEFLLATSSVDNSVSFWDLENFNLVSRSNSEHAVIRRLLFHSDGYCLFGGCVDQLNVFGWEPTRIFDTIATEWGKIQDITMSRDQLIGASFSQIRVQLCVVDLTKVLCTAPSTPKSNQISPFAHGQSIRKSFNKQTPRSSSKTEFKVKSIDEELDSEDDASNYNIPNVNDYEAAFKPNRSLNRSPPQFSSQVDISSEQRPSRRIVTLSAESTSEDDLSSSTVPLKLSERIVPTNTLLKNVPIPVRSVRSPPPALVTSSTPPLPLRRSATSINFSKLPVKKFNPLSPVGVVSSKNQTKQSLLPDVVARNRVEVKSSTKIYSTDINSDNEEVSAPINTSCTNEIRLEEFLPTSYRTSGTNSSHSQRTLSEGEIISSLTRNHEMVLTILKIRQRNLEIIYSLWHNQDLKCALESAIAMNDHAVLIDVLSAINKRPPLWNLDVCVVLLPALTNLLHSKYETYMAVCCESLQLMLKNFSSVIKSNVQWSSPTIGVDISKEERYAKCLKCYDELLQIRTFVLKKQTMQGKLGQSFRELQSLLYAIEK